MQADAERILKDHPGLTVGDMRYIGNVVVANGKTINTTGYILQPPIFEQYFAGDERTMWIMGEDENGREIYVAPFRSSEDLENKEALLAIDIRAIETHYNLSLGQLDEQKNKRT